MKPSALVRVGLVCLTFFALNACATPGETKADYRLQGSIQNMINANELAHGHIFGGRVVDTKVVSIDGQTITEHWMVKRGDRNVTYEVKLTPSPQGGTEIGITFPEEDRE